MFGFKHASVEDFALKIAQHFRAEKDLA